ncbi:AraC family transcriptional regulator [Pseudomonas sp. 21LCFQ010]|uniref:helix-turn-helix domain-containing protein n=1 Tax=Pseudomonas sp. 21LCFQ010 TaxID=2957506 RepID=UPI0020979BF6|nr:AraC family transcriptional regulator [Pseudomonas sp. 21LCFQ010]MCO8161875.1 AraC family transcriptional regulator [Pseudomonas sp. 21LCFQ010]
MDDLCAQAQPPAEKDFMHFQRLPEGGCELLSARFSRQAFGRHSHDYYAFGVISSGAEKLFYRGAYALGGPGSVVTLSPGEIHDGLPGHDSGWAYRMLYLDPAWVSRHLLNDAGSGQAIHLFTSAMQHAPALARHFVQQHRLLEQSDNPLERETALLDLLSQLFERNGVQPVRAAANAAEPWAVSQVRHKLDADFAQDISLADLAALVGLDPLYLIRVFKKHTGVSPHSYQIQKRVGRVQTLLRAGLSLAQASAACGFCDQSHMNRAFRKVVGLTPGKFR